MRAMCETCLSPKCSGSVRHECVRATDTGVRFGITSVRERERCGVRTWRTNIATGACDMMDEICQEQFMEMSYLNGGQEHGARGRGGMPGRGRGVPPGAAHRGRGMPPRGAARGAVSRGGPTRGGAVRGAPTGRGGPPAAPARGAAAVRARPPTSGPPQRMAPPHQHSTAASTDDYEDYGYDESYTETGYESYDSYYSQPQADPEYYDYSHGETTESYDSYGQDGWNGTQRTTPGKALPPSRGTKTPYREHPYRQY